MHRTPIFTFGRLFAMIAIEARYAIATSSDAARMIRRPAVDDLDKTAELMGLLTHIVIVQHDQLVVDDSDKDP